MRAFPAAAALTAALCLGAAPLSFAAMPAASTVTPMTAPVAGIGSDPAVQSLIQRYYAAHAQEGASCGPVTMDSVLSAPTIGSKQGAVTLQVGYSFSTVDPQKAGTDCSGMATREFTLSRDGSGWAVQLMSGATAG